MKKIPFHSTGVHLFFLHVWRLGISIILFSGTLFLAPCIFADSLQQLPQLTVVNRVGAPSVSPSENVGFDYVTTAGTSSATFVGVHFTDPSGLGLDAAAVTNVGSGTVSKAVGSGWLNGVYMVSYVVLKDSSGRFIYYKRDGTITVNGGTVSGPFTHTLDLARMDFQVIGATDQVVLPQLTVVNRVGAPSVSPSENVGFDYVTTAGTSSVTFVGVHFTDPAGLELDAAAVTNVGSGTVSKTVGSGWLNGVYMVSYVVLKDSSGRFIYYKRDGTITVNGGTVSGSATHTLNLARMDFQVIGAIAPSGAPVFITQPLNVTVDDGGSFSVSLKVTTSDSSFVTWRLNLANRNMSPSIIAVARVNNVITASLTFGPIDMSDAGSFQVVATNNSGTTSSSSRILAVNAIPPAIRIQPMSQTAIVGNPVSFSVTASGTGALTYQWRKNGVSINGATGNSYRIAKLALSDAGNYTAVATNMVGSATSEPGLLTVIPAVVTFGAALGDFNGDGRADLVWTNSQTGERSMWFLNGNTQSGGASLGVVPVAWVVSATADFDGDGKGGIFWTNTVTGDRAVWLMNGSTRRTNAFMGTVPVDWVISGTGDFNGDGKSDLVWTNTTSGDRAMWLMNGSTVLGGGYLGTVPVEWTISGVGDFNGDGKADLIWSNTATGERSMWFQNGSTTTGGATLNTVPVAWVISGVGDFNGDGKADVFLSNTISGDRVIWLMNGSTIATNAFMGTVPVDWSVSGTGDFNADGKKDLFWTNTATGDRAMWLLNGATVTGGGFMGTVPVVWRINN